MEGLLASITFRALSDAELGCLYDALARLVDLVAREEITLQREEVYGGRLTAILASVDQPKLSDLYRLGHEVHRELERRGLDRVESVLGAQLKWPFAGMGAYIRALKRSLDRRMVAA